MVEKSMKVLKGAVRQYYLFESHSSICIIDIESLDIRIQIISLN